MSCVLVNTGRQTDMTFDELIERNEEYMIDPYETWVDLNDPGAWAESEDCTLDLIEWYLALIIRSV
jgi:hypothetical protein